MEALAEHWSQKIKARSLIVLMEAFLVVSHKKIYVYS